MGLTLGTTTNGKAATPLYFGFCLVTAETEELRSVNQRKYRSACAPEGKRSPVAREGRRKRSSTSLEPGSTDLGKRGITRV